MEDKGWSELDLLAILAIHSHLVDNAYFILYYEKLEQHSKNWINMKIWRNFIGSHLISTIDNSLQQSKGLSVNLELDIQVIVIICILPTLCNTFIKLKMYVESFSMRRFIDSQWLLYKMWN